ncbi:hypothetical protein QN372_00805 [Undibacterium sp. RTI2.1]|uniref:hypothetical protein n=1 Tax=unclassified Undibacterium TaxID=2630295 RepID=UPI002AB35436|nr:MULTISPECIES: hypothetical protein [unclassified Undibacterium]MDY7537676.1 hypothetical protein [Undibacterium sp. 5I1]MEB0029278.1 hypothetical protein [Undibacterium sp. RTI2.1]MEB0115586.1 hypothetical protein [Undibacterium sp. RTI2.2]MEB0256413.1 hypothetical protein [Undibacterium sp. 5I1]
MSSIPEQVMVVMLGALTGNTAAGGNVFRSRATAIAHGEVPCIAIMCTDEESSVFNSSVDENTLVVTVEVHTRGDPFDTLADPILIDIHRLLLGNAGLRSLVDDLRKKSKSWEEHEAEQTAGFVTTRYQMRYLQPANDLTTTI